MMKGNVEACILLFPNQNRAQWYVWRVKGLVMSNQWISGEK
jgi:hypothetical protein